MEEVLVSGSIDAQGKLHVAARAVLCPAQRQNAGTDQENLTVAGDRQTVFIPDVSNLAADASTADLATAGLQAQFNAAFVCIGRGHRRGQPSPATRLKRDKSMAAFTAIRDGNWSDTSSGGPWGSVAAYPGQNNTADTVAIGCQRLSRRVPAYTVASISFTSGCLVVTGAEV